MLCMGAVILLLSWLKHLAGGRVKRFLGHHQPVDSLGQRERAQQFEQPMHLIWGFWGQRQRKVPSATSHCLRTFPLSFKHHIVPLGDTD